MEAQVIPFVAQVDVRPGAHVLLEDQGFRLVHDDGYEVQQKVKGKWRRIAGPFKDVGEAHGLYEIQVECEPMSGVIG